MQYGYGHYSTFDDLQYTLQGDCTYVIMKLGEEDRGDFDADKYEDEKFQDISTGVNFIVEVFRTHNISDNINNSHHRYHTCLE